MQEVGLTPKASLLSRSQVQVLLWHHRGCFGADECGGQGQASLLNAKCSEEQAVRLRLKAAVPLGFEAALLQCREVVVGYVPWRAHRFGASGGQR